MALRFAVDPPGAVRSSVLLEPPLMMVPSDPRVPRADELRRAGDGGTDGHVFRKPAAAGRSMSDGFVWTIPVTGLAGR